MFQHFATIDLRQSFFDLADEPFVVIRQTLNCLMHQRFSVASLLRGNAVKLGLQLWRKVYFHAASVSGPPSSVKAFAANQIALQHPFGGDVSLATPGAKHASYGLGFAPLELAAQDFEVGFLGGLNQLQTLRGPSHA